MSDIEDIDSNSKNVKDEKWPMANHRVHSIIQ